VVSPTSCAWVTCRPPPNTPLQQTKPRNILSAFTNRVRGFAAERQVVRPQPIPLLIKVEEAGVLAEMLRARKSAGRRMLVAVDGLTGSGKSTLSRELTASVPAAHVSVDSYVVCDQGTYVAHVRIPELTERVHRELEYGNVVLLDSVCCAAVLQRLALQADFRIYVTRLDGRGEWSDGEPFTSGLTEEDAIEREEALVAGFGVALTELRREILRYHFAFRPWERADVRYEHRDALEAFDH
jgi:hypothetical protein